MSILDTCQISPQVLITVEYWTVDNIKFIDNVNANHCHFFEIFGYAQQFFFSNQSH